MLQKTMKVLAEYSGEGGLDLHLHSRLTAFVSPSKSQSALHERSEDIPTQEEMQFRDPVREQERPYEGDGKPVER